LNELGLFGAVAPKNALNAQMRPGLTSTLRDDCASWSVGKARHLDQCARACRMHGDGFVDLQAIAARRSFFFVQWHHEWMIRSTTYPDKY
jgi:hypothetical protein